MLFQRDSSRSQSAVTQAVQEPLFTLSKKGSPNCLADVSTGNQLQNNASFPSLSLFKWHFFTWLRGSKRNKGESWAWCMTDVAMLLSAMLCGIRQSPQVHLSYSIAMQGRTFPSGFINHYHSSKLWEAGKIWDLCKPKFLEAGKMQQGTIYVLASFLYSSVGFLCWPLLEMVGGGYLL